MNFASGMGESSVSALEYAYKLYVVIYGIFSYAVGNTDTAVHAVHAVDVC